MSKESRSPPVDQGETPTAPDQRSASVTVAAADEKAAPIIFPIVGIGASAGGVEALTRFFDAMPSDSGMAFIVVLHLDPSHDSLLASILARHTTMPVGEIVDGMQIAPNTVHVIVPDRSVTVQDGRLRLSEPREPRGHRRPVDVLFTSLATEYGERAIGIILSGTGTNGTHGLREIKGHGGLTLVQDPASADFAGMPRSAILANVADQVLPPEALPDIMLRYARHESLDRTPLEDGENEDAPGQLDSVLTVLRGLTGQDFRSYKPNTLIRRIHRRMRLGNLDSLQAYSDSLRANPAEAEALVNDMMISVTDFFRDQDAWKVLGETVIAPLVAARESGAVLRFWVPACASGEEAYSLAMLTLEYAEAAGKTFDVKIFATDAQEINLRVGRAGLYLEAAVAVLGGKRLRRFFDRKDSSYVVRRELREIVIFAPQNLLRDPPFSRLDLITCRNVLIYLRPEAQRKLLSLFHFGLRENGNLFLGSAETIGRQDDLFETLSKKWRIYRRLGTTNHDITDFPMLGKLALAGRAEAGTGERSLPVSRVADITRRFLLARYAPASALIEQNGQLLYLHGATGDYLAPPSGEPSRDILAMAREGLPAGLRRAIRLCIEGGAPSSFEAQIRQGETLRRVFVTVSPVPGEQHAMDGLLLVSFEPAEAGVPVPMAATPASSASLNEQALEEELQSARRELRDTLDRMEDNSEEQKAAHEEITSMNEELQSTNEELETSKEELQSFNEELHTVNSQLQHKNQELEDTTNDLSNLLAATEIATVFLDRDLRIKWFSPTSRDLLDLVPSDIGRPLASFALKFSDPDLQRDARMVLAELTSSDAVVRSDAGRSYLRRMLPYRTRDDKSAGLVVAFIDVTEREAASKAANDARIHAEAIVDTIHEPLLVLDNNLNVQSANPAFHTLFRTTSEEITGHNILEMANGQWDIPLLRSMLEDTLRREGAATNVLLDHTFEGLGRRIFRLNALQQHHAPSSEPGLVVLALEDITDWHEASAHRDLLLAEMGHRVKNSLATVMSIAWQTAQQCVSLAEFTPAFEGRLQALARAHDLLVNDGLIGTDLGAIMRLTLAPYDLSSQSRIVVTGDAIALQPQTGTALVMILHELATNAAKYGALSTPTGKLEVHWELLGDAPAREVAVYWRESKGPAVVPPSRRGFGTSLIERSAAYELHGTATLEYRPAGFQAELRFPFLDPADLPSPARIA